MIATSLKGLPQNEKVRRLRMERRERAEAGNWRIFKLPAQPDGHDFVVRNVDSGSVYRVAWEPSADMASCTCEDFKNTCRRFGILCKHVEAVKLQVQGERAPIPLAGRIVPEGGRYSISLGPGNGRLVNYHLRHGCSCFMKTFCYRSGQKCFHSTMLDRWVEAGADLPGTPLDAPVVRERVVALPSDRPYDEFRVYEGALSRTWSVLPKGSRAYVVDNGGKEVPHQVVLAAREGACSCGKFYQAGQCAHVDMVRDALRRRVLLRPRNPGKSSRSRTRRALKG
ncbi:MAG: SWIM zinc finger domain-containing protein [Chloroflexi bacterium]|nr:SWIM zinc finger domain-containing protein [Chloroflexota bacterium]